MYPRPHGQLCNKDIAALGEEDWCLGRDHFDFWIRLHDLLNASQGQLVDFELVSIILEMCDSLLPIGGEDVFVLASETLMNLKSKRGKLALDSARYESDRGRVSDVRLPMALCKARPARILVRLAMVRVRDNSLLAGRDVTFA